LNLPVCSVRDLVVQGDDLVVATHGRGFWILDDASLLRQIDVGVSFSEAHLYRPATAIRLNPEFFPGTPLPPEEPQAKNPPSGAILDFYLRAAPTSEVAIEILDAKNTVVRRYSNRDPAPPPPAPAPIADSWLAPPQRLAPRAGMNRFVWDLRYTLPAAAMASVDIGPDDPPPVGPLALPGAYQVRLAVDGRPYTQPLTVAMDPRTSATAEDLAEQWEVSSAIVQALGRAEKAETAALAFRRQLDARRQAAQTAGKSQIVGKILMLDHDAARVAAAIGPLVVRMNLALSVAQSADRTPPATAYQIFDETTREMTQLLSDWNTLRTARVADIDTDLAAAGLPPVQ
jgi:hypothetical protein